MTPPHTPANEAPAKARRRWPRIIGFILLVLALLLAALFWYSGREATLQDLVRRIALASNGSLTVEGATGSLHGAMHVKRIVQHTPERDLVAENVDIVWAPWHLVGGNIAVSRLHAGTVTINNKQPSKEKPTLPASLAPPMAVAIEDAQVDKLIMLDQGDQSTRMEFSNARLALEADKRSIRLKNLQAATPWGAFAATGSVDAQQPFALRGGAALVNSGSTGTSAGNSMPFPLQARAVLRGSLSEPLIDARADSYSAHLDAALRLTPFGPIPWRSIDVTGRGINPAQFKPGGPQADLALQLHAAVQEQDTLAGSLEVRNQLETGPVDKQRIPLKAIRATLGGRATADQVTAQLSDVLLDLGAAGQFTGSGRLDDDGRAQLALHTNRIDMRHILASMHPTAIAGDITLGSAPRQGQTLVARLSESGLRLELDALMREQVVRLQRARLFAGGGEIELAGNMNLKDKQPFEASGSVRRFNPAKLGDYPEADLNAQIKLKGALMPAWQVAAELAFQPSRLLQQPLSGYARLQADAKHVRDVDAALQLGGNNLTAKGDFGRESDKLQWNVDARNLAALQAGLGGSVQAAGVLSGSMEQPSTTLDARAAGLRFTPAKGKAAAADNVLQASGEVALRGNGPFRLKGDVARLSPASFGPYPAGNINARFDASGNLGKERHVALDLQFSPSTLANAPLTGHARFNADTNRVSNADVNLQLGPNTLTARGALGAAADQLRWQLQAPQLAALGSQFAGAASGAGVLGGRLDALSADFKLEGQGLRFMDQVRIRQLQAAGKWQQGAQPATSPLQANLALTDAKLGALLLQALQLQASGTLGAHTLQLTANTADATSTTAATVRPAMDAKPATPLPPLHLSVEVAGGWREKRGWEGSIRSLQNRGPLAFTLQSPARLAVGPGHFLLQNLVLALPSGSVQVQRAEQSPGVLKSSGHASGIPFNYLAQLSPQLAASIRGNADASLTIGADWNLTAQQTMDGSIRVFREKGDLTLRSSVPSSGGPVPLGLSEFDARVDIVRNALQARLVLDGTRTGRVELQAASRLGQRGGNWLLPADSPLQFQLGAIMPSIAWLAPLSGVPGLEFDGRMGLSLAGRGTVGSPILAGDINGEQLALRWPDEGVRLHNGALRAHLQGEQLTLQQLRFEGEEGSLEAGGTIRLADAIPTMELRFSADKLRALSRPDRVLVVSGQSTLSIDQKRLQLQGKLRADRAEIELPTEKGITISNDVVVLGAPKKEEKPVTALPLNIDLDLDLGDRFTLRGRGLDAQLAGSVRVRSQEQRGPAALRATGTIRVKEGTYAAYGQRLQIERGVITFTGPLENPSLNILAVRKRLALESAEDTVEAGVEVRGTALAPVAKLVSTPNVPDSEKLSWLVLGHGTSSAGSRERDLLAAAAGALFSSSKGPSLQTRIASALNLDEVGMARAQGLETTVLTLGKRISSRAYLSYEQGVSGATSLVRLRYALTSRFSIIAQTGTASAIDLFYFFSFD